ncbi:MAG: phosphatidylglycerophosphatase A [Legionellales bacterium]|nr:phosphatidylglycerophosphatase A [Legionellales bacterium]
MSIYSQLGKHPVYWLACGLGTGCLPKAPGTWGTLLAVVIYYLALRHFSAAGYLLIVLLALVVGIYLCDRTGKQLGQSDHPAIVWDEMVGWWLAVWLIPSDAWGWMVISVVLFRIFDICKPWPIGWVDRRVKGGLGVMLDDVIAGGLTWGCLQVGWVLVTLVLKFW